MAGAALALALPWLFARHAAALSVEVVVAHYNEDLSWMGKYESPEVEFTVYTKDGARNRHTVEMLPNVGRESQTYLHHIVRHYDDLAPWTVFTQGAAPAWGYRNGDSRSGHLTGDVTFADYLQAFPGGRESFFVLSAACHIPTGMQTTRLDIMSKDLEGARSGFCPAAGADGWSAWWFDAKHPHHKQGNAMLDFYHEHILEERAARRPVTLGFVQGARFSLSRDRIHSRSREYYSKLLRQVSQERDPIQGYFMEAMWFDVFHPQREQSQVAACSYPEVPSGPVMGPSEMYRSTVHRLRRLGKLSRDYVGAYLPGIYDPPLGPGSHAADVPGIRDPPRVPDYDRASGSGIYDPPAVPKYDGAYVPGIHDPAPVPDHDGTSVPGVYDPLPVPDYDSGYVPGVHEPPLVPGYDDAPVPGVPSPTASPTSTFPTLSPTVTPEPIVQPAPEPSPSPTAMPVPGTQQSFRGRISMLVPQLAQFLADGPVPTALVGAMREALSERTGVDAANVEVDFAAGRRLADFLPSKDVRRLQAQSALIVNYKINFPPGINISAQVVKQVMDSVTVAEVRDTFIRKLLESPDVPQSLKDDADRILILLMSTSEILDEVPGSSTTRPLMRSALVGSGSPPRVACTAMARSLALVTLGVRLLLL